MLLKKRCYQVQPYAMTWKFCWRRVTHNWTNQESNLMPLIKTMTMSKSTSASLIAKLWSTATVRVLSQKAWLSTTAKVKTITMKAMKLKVDMRSSARERSKESLMNLIKQQANPPFNLKRSLVKEPHIWWALQVGSLAQFLQSEWPQNLSAYLKQYSSELRKE